MEPLLIGDVYVNVECSCGNTSSPYNLCDGSHWSCKWKKSSTMTIRFNLFAFLLV